MSESTYLIIGIISSCVIPVVLNFWIFGPLERWLKKRRKNIEPKPPIPAVWIFWTVIVTVSVVFVLYLAETRWALSLLSSFISAIGFLAFAIGCTGLVFLLMKKTRTEMAICIGILLLALTGYFVDRVLPHYVSISCPSFVGDTAIIRGNTAHWGTWNVRVLLHPLKSEEWWVEQIPVPDESGRWRIECTFGGSSQERFEILAIASHEDIPLERGQTILPNKIPDKVYRSRIYEVEKQ